MGVAKDELVNNLELIKFVEPTYYNQHDILGTPFNEGYGVGRASGSDHYGCAHNQYTSEYGSGITPYTTGQGRGIGRGEAFNNFKTINHEQVF